MKVLKTKLEGVLIVEPDVFYDTRGYFYESFSKNKYAEAGIDKEFVQDNVSRSNHGTVRGLHYQVGDNTQGKLCQIISGKVIDFAVDIRFNSPTFGGHIAVELSDENKRQLWIPPGFAHGFSVISEQATFYYKCTGFYCKADERTILFSDPDLNIDWKVNDPIVSDKDKQGRLFRDIEKDFIYMAENAALD